MNYHVAELEARDFDRWLTLTEKAAHKVAVDANDAFAKAMRAAIKSKRVKVKEATFVDDRPLMAAPIRGFAPVSITGSPAAMCADQGGPR
jgi:hypothetical protein